MKSVIGIVAAAVLAASPAFAAGGKVTKAEIAQALSTAGYSVQDFQPGMIVVHVGEHRVVVGIDGSDGDITYLTYLPGLSIDAIGHEFLSKFNSEVKFGRAYVDRDGDVTIQMDRNSSGGVSIANVKSDFDVFLLLVSKFLSDIESRVSA